MLPNNRGLLHRGRCRCARVTSLKARPSVGELEVLGDEKTLYPDVEADARANLPRRLVGMVHRASVHVGRSDHGEEARGHRLRGGGFYAVAAPMGSGWHSQSAHPAAGDRTVKVLGDCRTRASVTGFGRGGRLELAANLC